MREPNQILTARDLMTTHLLCFSPNQTLLEAIEKLIKWRVSGAPVVDEEGRVPGVAMVIPREMVGRVISIAAVGIGLAWILGDKKRQGWHDKIAGTFVVRKQ